MSRVTFDYLCCCGVYWSVDGEVEVQVEAEIEPQQIVSRLIFDKHEEHGVIDRCAHG